MTTESVVEQLVATAGIERVVCVDDAFSATLNDFTEVLAGLTSAQRAKVTGLVDNAMAIDGVWQTDVAAVWGQSEREAQVAMVDNAYAIDGELPPLSWGAVETLRRLLPGIAPEGLTLASWREKRAQVLVEMGSTPTLILFDLDFSREVGGDATTGQRLIGELEVALRDQGFADDAYYGLLTNHVLPGDEHERRLQIVNSAGLDPARFVLISKQHLQGDPATFAVRLRTTFLAPIFAGLMVEVDKAIRSEYEKALREALAIAPEDMEQMVVRTSGLEGVWEPDTLVRLFELLQRSGARSTLRTTDRVVKLTERLRKLAEIDPAPKDDVTHAPAGDVANDVPTLEPQGAGAAAPIEMAEQREVDSVRTAVSAVEDATGGDALTPTLVSVAVVLQHQEIYETAEHINGLHLPLELGDLFTKDTGDKQFVLIAQPCDAMVRAGGARSPELSHFLLAEVTMKPLEGLFAAFELPYFDENTGHSAYVKLSRPVYTRSIVLDACVLNANGCAHIELAAMPAEGLLPHWRDRHVALKRAAKSILDRVAAQDQPPSMDLRKILAGYVKPDPFPPTQMDPTAGVLEWNCTRVGRVLDPYARALLSRFSQFFARDAYLHDLARR